jgi:hypothetical protein
MAHQAAKSRNRKTLNADDTLATQAATIDPPIHSHDGSSDELAQGLEQGLQSPLREKTDGAGREVIGARR